MSVDTRERGMAMLSRRDCLAMSLAVLSGVARGQSLSPPVPEARLERAAEAVKDLLAGRTPNEGKVRLSIPKLAENGLSVPLVATVDSPMTVEDYVRTLHIIAPVNPIPTVTRVHFTPRSGEAYLSTRIRLADSQELLGFAEMSDGSVWLGKAHVVVTLGGCLDPIL